MRRNFTPTTRPLTRSLSRISFAVGKAMAIVQFKLCTVALLFALCVLVPLTSARSAKVKYCEKTADYDVEVSGVEIIPFPVARGKPATFSIAASTTKPIPDGKLLLEVSLFGVHVHSEERDLCSETSCPVSAGKFVISHTQVLPGYTPPGSYTLKMSMVDGDKRQLTCVKFDFRIGFGTSEAVADS